MGFSKDITPKIVVGSGTYTRNSGFLDRDNASENPGVWPLSVKEESLHLSRDIPHNAPQVTNKDLVVRLVH